MRRRHLPGPLRAAPWQNVRGVPVFTEKNPLAGGITFLEQKNGKSYTNRPLVALL